MHVIPRPDPIKEAGILEEIRLINENPTREPNVSVSIAATTLVAISRISVQLDYLIQLLEKEE